LLALLVSTEACAYPFFAANSSGTLAQFDTTSPGAAGTSVVISGIGLGESIVGIDTRPLDLQLYVLTKDGSNAGRLYRVDATSGAATLVASLTANPGDPFPYTGLVGTRFGISFQPVVDRLRLVTDAGQNFRINPSTGTVFHDTDLNPGTPHVVAVAYINSFHGATATTLYDIDSNLDALLIQNPANNGTLTMVGSGLGVNMLDLVGFDIAMAGTTNVAYATALVGGNVNLYSIDLASGLASLVGGLNGNFQTVGIAIVQDRIFANGFE